MDWFLITVIVSIFIVIVVSEKYLGNRIDDLEDRIEKLEDGEDIDID